MTLTFLKGTGKWRGTTGGGKALSITSSNPKTPGTFYGCQRVTGKIEFSNYVFND